MYQGKQCDKCLRHFHEDFYDEKKGKKWVVDRCAHCKKPFDFQPFVGSETFFNSQFKKFREVNED